MSIPIETYKAIKRKYRDAILLFRTGDVYELFGEDAKTASRMFGLTLTQVANDEVKETASFPFYSLDSHLRTLVKAGYKVAICEQLKGRKTAKGKQKGCVEDGHKP